MSIAGTSLLVTALVFSLAGAISWVRVIQTPDISGDAGRGLHCHGRLERAGRTMTLSAFAFSAGAVMLMEVALLRHDTSLAYVAKTVESAMPAYYRITSLWSAMEGSLLLWLLCVAAAAAVFVSLRHRLPAGTVATAAAVLCGIVAVFTVVALVASPFAAAQGPVGARPSPLLQDHPAMGVHPPLLYAGFAALAVPYALSVGALLTRTAGVPWARVVRRWTLAAWIPLTAGVLLGAWWSYAVLGWGGYWAWDPVENASLMPWLIATALLHAVGPRARGGGWQSWSVLLAGAAFIFVLLATFLTRSGVIQSIHAFSTSPLGPVLLGILAAALLPWIVLAGRRRVFLRSPGPAPVLSRQTALQINRVLLVLITAIVLIGSVLPAVLLALTGDRLSVGPPWYGRTLAPLGIALLVLMAIGPWLSWRGDNVPALLRRLLVPGVAAAVTSGTVGLLVPDVWLAVVSGLAMFVLISFLLRLTGSQSRRRDRQGAGALLAHLGIAIGAVAVVAGGHAATVQETLAVGGSVSASGTSATLIGVERQDDGRRSIAEARLLLAEDGVPIGTLNPQLRWYEQHGAMLAGPEIRTEPFRDVYVTLLDVDPAAGTATVRLAVTPLITWLWVAGGLTVAGSAVAAWPRRRRRPQPPAEKSPKPLDDRRARYHPELVP